MMKTPRVKGLHFAAKMIYQVLKGTVCVILPLTQQHSHKAAMQSSQAEHHQRSRGGGIKKKSYTTPRGLSSSF